MPSYHQPRYVFLRIGLVLCLILMLPVFQARGAVFYVSDSSDDTNGFTLRSAVILANFNGGSNTIILTNNTYQLTLTGVDEDTALTGDLDITNGNLTIVGASAAKATIDATALGDRVFQIFSGTQLTLSNLVITGGVAPSGTNDSSGGNGENGGGIFNAGTLTLYDSIVSSNASGAGGGAISGFGSGGNGGNGGGIYNASTLILHNSTVSGNLSGLGGDGGELEGNGGSNSQGGNGGDGGGIYNVGILMLDTSTISNNTNSAGGLLYGNGGNGGGIYNDGTLSMTNTVVTNNSSGSDGASSGSGGNGGGIYNVSLSTLNNCVISGNSGGGGGGANDSFSAGGGGGASGGGIFNGGNLVLNYCTVSHNSSGAGAGGGSVVTSRGSFGLQGGAGGGGGGVYNTNMAILNNCTISDNNSGDGGPGGNGQGFLSGATGGNGSNGGGIYNVGDITLSLCTVSDNSSGSGGNGGQGSGAGNGGTGGNGGGIFSDGIQALIACTVSDNSCGTGGNGGYNDARSIYSNVGGTGGSGGSGGGIFNGTNSQSANLSDTLIALNAIGVGGSGGGGSGGILYPPPPPTPSINGANGIGLDFSGNYTSQGYNLIGQADGGTGLTNGINNDLVGSTNAPINPLLGPLQDNGGPTFTHALLLNSPAIDQGINFGLTTDQRGHSRPHDYFSIPNASGGDGSDIGAFESDTPILNIQKLTNNILLSWDTNCPNYTLEFTADLTTSNSWTPVLNKPSVMNRQYQVTNDFTTDRKFFRLRSN